MVIVSAGSQRRNSGLNVNLTFSEQFHLQNKDRLVSRLHRLEKTG